MLLEQNEKINNLLAIYTIKDLDHVLEYIILKADWVKAI